MTSFHSWWLMSSSSSKSMGTQPAWAAGMRAGQRWQRCGHTANIQVTEAEKRVFRNCVSGVGKLLSHKLQDRCAVDVVLSTFSVKYRKWTRLQLEHRPANTLSCVQAPQLQGSGAILVFLPGAQMQTALISVSYVGARLNHDFPSRRDINVANRSGMMLNLPSPRPLEPRMRTQPFKHPVKPSSSMYV